MCGAIIASKGQLAHFYTNLGSKRLPKNFGVISFIMVCRKIEKFVTSSLFAEHVQNSILISLINL